MGLLSKDVNVRGLVPTARVVSAFIYLFRNKKKKEKVVFCLSFLLLLCLKI